LNLLIVQFLPNRVFNSNHFLQFCVCSMLISCRNKWETKCHQSENPKLSVSLFCFSPNPNGFSPDRLRNVPQIPNFSLWQKFFKIICMPRPPLKIGRPRARTHSTPARAGPDRDHQAISWTGWILFSNLPPYFTKVHLNIISHLRLELSSCFCPSDFTVKFPSDICHHHHWLTTIKWGS
jgi:hypothetical protein